MKKLLTLTAIAMLFACIQTSAQLQKGEKALGATLNFMTSKAKSKNMFGTSENEATGFSFSPDLSFGLGGNWILGVAGGYNYSKQKGTSSVTSTAKGFSAGAFVRKFYPLGSGKFGLFGQGNFAYDHTKYESGNPASKATGKGMSVSVQPGAYVRASKRFIIEAYVGSIGYSHGSNEPDNNTGGWKSTVNSFSASFTDDLSLGFKIVL